MTETTRPAGMDEVDECGNAIHDDESKARRAAEIKVLLAEGVAIRRLEAEVAALRRDLALRHDLLKIQHAESVELWNALKDLSFECDDVTRVCAPTRETYNRTFAVLQSKTHLSPEALRGYGDGAAKAQA